MLFLKLVKVMNLFKYSNDCIIDRICCKTTPENLFIRIILIRKDDFIIRNKDQKKSCKSNTYRIKFQLSHYFVELAGIEPASKRGSNMLSTCLSPDLIFE